MYEDGKLPAERAWKTQEKLEKLLKKFEGPRGAPHDVYEEFVRQLSSDERGYAEGAWASGIWQLGENLLWAVPPAWREVHTPFPLPPLPHTFYRATSASTYVQAFTLCANGMEAPGNSFGGYLLTRSRDSEEGFPNCHLWMHMRRAFDEKVFACVCLSVCVCVCAR